jgi:hypothetical protein
MKRLAIVVDVGSGAESSIPIRPEFQDLSLVGRPSCRPFGITWNSEEAYVANNRQILVFDRQFRYRRTLPVRVQINIHQLGYHNGVVWAVSPWTNSVIGVSPTAQATPIELNLIEHQLRSYIEVDACESDDRHHFNSLLWSGRYLFVAAHAFGTGSFVSRYDAETLALQCVNSNLGHSIHGLAFYDGELFWLSSGTGEVRSSNGYALTLSRRGYARGFAMTAEYFVVAVSEFLSRDERWGGDSWIQVIDRNQNCLVKEVHLHDTGSINDLRLLDAYDYAHQVTPFE